MKERESFSWRKRLRSFKYAKEGCGSLLRYEHNFRIHLCAAFIAVVLGFLLSISLIEWCVIILCIGGVFTAEALNSSIEILCDRISPEQDPLIKRTKDIAAAAVTFAALSALIVGIIIFLPKIITVASN